MKCSQPKDGLGAIFTSRANFMFVGLMYHEERRAISVVATSATRTVCTIKTRRHTHGHKFKVFKAETDAFKALGSWLETVAGLERAHALSVARGLLHGIEDSFEEKAKELRR